MWTCEVCGLKLICESVEYHMMANHYVRIMEASGAKRIVEKQTDYPCQTCDFKGPCFESIAQHCLTTKHSLSDKNSIISLSSAQHQTADGSSQFLQALIDFISKLTKGTTTSGDSSDIFREKAEMKNNLDNESRGETIEWTGLISSDEQQQSRRSSCYGGNILEDDDSSTLFHNDYDSRNSDNNVRSLQDSLFNFSASSIAGTNSRGEDSTLMTSCDNTLNVPNGSLLPTTKPTDHKSCVLINDPLLIKVPDSTLKICNNNNNQSNDIIHNKTFQSTERFTETRLPATGQLQDIEESDPKDTLGSFPELSNSDAETCRIKKKNPDTENNADPSAAYETTTIIDPDRPLDLTPITIDGKRMFPCSVCVKVYPNRTKAVDHANLHNNVKPYTCGYCDRRFRLETTLIGHERTHTGERPFQCNKCGKTFKQKSTANRHLKMHLK